jgi:hypothetical protein
MHFPSQAHLLTALLYHDSMQFGEGTVVQQLRCLANDILKSCID